MQRKREHLWIGVVVAAAALAAFLWVLLAEHDEARTRVAYEHAALERLRRVAEAQQTYRERRGRFGWATELRDVGLLEAAWIAADGSVRAPRYRIDVLLPTGLSPREFVRIAPQAAGTLNSRLVKHHFAVVARPWGELRSGHRSYYLDEHGALYLSEGATDVAGGHEPPLPDLHLTQSRVHDLGGLRWWPSQLAGGSWTRH